MEDGGSFSVTFRVSASVRLRLPVRAHPRHSWTAARGHTLFTDTYRRESTHVPNGSGLRECAHVKSLYETSIVGRIMNRYVQCSSHLFSYPATGAVTCVHTQLRATVTRTMPSIDPSSMESKRSAKSCTCAGAGETFRGEVALSTRRRCAVY